MSLHHEGAVESAPDGAGLDVRPAFTLTLLGHWSLRCARGPVRLTAGLRRPVALLALRGPLPRPVVAGTLWPEVPDAQAAAGLRSALWRLNKLAPGVLTDLSGHLDLGPTVRVDVRDLARSAATLLAHGDEPSPARWETTVPRGELLPGWFDEWVEHERERIRQQQMHALEALAVALCEQGRFAAALDAALASVHVEPLRETGHLAVMHVHLAEGNRVEAYRQLERYRNLLQVELGIEPSPRMSELAGIPVPDGRRAG